MAHWEYGKQRKGGRQMNPRETINDILVNLFNEIWKLEEEAITVTMTKGRWIS